MLRAPVNSPSSQSLNPAKRILPLTARNRRLRGRQLKAAGASGPADLPLSRPASKASGVFFLMKHIGKKRSPIPKYDALNELTEGSPRRRATRNAGRRRTRRRQSAFIERWLATPDHRLAGRLSHHRAAAEFVWQRLPGASLALYGPLGPLVAHPGSTQRRRQAPRQRKAKHREKVART